MVALKRNLAVFEAHCLRQDHRFEAYNFSDFQYGERVIRTADGEEFALMVLEDTVVDEVEKIIADTSGSFENDRELARRFNKVFGLSCDPLDGKQLDASVGIICPVCKSPEVDYRDAQPPRYKTFLIPVITHEKWSTMNHEEKHSLIQEGLRSGLMNGTA